VSAATEYLFFHYSVFRKLRTPGFIIKCYIKFQGQCQKLEAEAEVSRGQGQRLRGRDRGQGQNFGLAASLTSLSKTNNRQK